MERDLGKLNSQYLLALVADIICISVHGEACGVVVETCPGGGDGFTLMQTLILQPHQSFSSYVLIQLLDRIKQVLNHRVIDFVLKAQEET